jgi:hypothetical protein
MAEHSGLPITLAAQQFRKSQALATRLLHLRQPQHALAASHVQALLAGLQHGARRLVTSFGQSKSGPNLQSLSLPKRMCTWEGVEGTNTLRQHRGCCSDQLINASCLSILAA